MLDLPDFAALDHSSVCNADAYKISHLSFDLAVDFAAKSIAGTVTYTVSRNAGVADDTPLRLDSSAGDSVETASESIAVAQLEPQDGLPVVLGRGVAVTGLKPGFGGWLHSVSVRGFY